MRSILLLATLATLLAGCSSPDISPVPTPPARTTADATPAPDAELQVELESVAEGFSRPLLLTHDSAGALYVLEQDGKIWQLRGGERTLWLDLDPKVGSGGNEQGLLGLAWEPDGERAYVSYTDNDGNSVLSRIDASTSEEPILRQEQPYSNHNGGHVAFGPDGYLYYGLGDGGSGGDPQGNGQDPETLLGSLLRLDVSGATGYDVPPDNPYVGGGGKPEIWAKGLRNPWRFSFDRATDDLYIADVGQGAWEEIDYVAAGTPGGLNFGWAAFEANERNALRQAFSEVTPPVHAYPLRVDGHCAVIGGHVYRGAASPALDGEYLFGDHCSGEIWGMRFVRDACPSGTGTSSLASGSSAQSACGDGEWRVRLLLDTDLNITSFGEDAEGEVYVVAREGGIYRLVAA